MNVPGLPGGLPLIDDQGRPLFVPTVQPLPGGLPATDDQGRPLLPSNEPLRRLRPVRHTDATANVPIVPLLRLRPLRRVPNVPGAFDPAFPFVSVPTAGVVDTVKERTVGAVVKEIGLVLLWTSPAWLAFLVLSLPSKRGAR